MLAEPIEIVSRLSKTGLLLFEELIKVGPDTYLEKKMRKSPFMLQKWGLVLTFEDEANGKWYLLMHDEVREKLSPIRASYIEMAKAGKNGPSAKDLRIASFIAEILGHSDFTITNETVINHRVSDPKD